MSDAGEEPMDVHPPHHAISTWRDFFVHMATICLGLLIALGLEQTVEAIHRAHERHELREALDHDSRQAIDDATRSKRFFDEYIQWLRARIKTVQVALAANQTPPPEPPFQPAMHWNVATDPAFEAAKASGQLGLLTQEEVRAYSEADRVTGDLAKVYDEGETGIQTLRTLAVEAGSADGKTDFSKLDPQELRQYRDILVRQLWSAVLFRVRSEQVRALQSALLDGERNFTVLQRIEHEAETPIPGFSMHF